jgi:hypothetical protein
MLGMAPAEQVERFGREAASCCFSHSVARGGLADLAKAAHSAFDSSLMTV